MASHSGTHAIACTCTPHCPRLAGITCPVSLVAAIPRSPAFHFVCSRMLRWNVISRVTYPPVPVLAMSGRAAGFAMVSTIPFGGQNSPGSAGFETSVKANSNLGALGIFASIPHRFANNVSFQTSIDQLIWVGSMPYHKGKRCSVCRVALQLWVKVKHMNVKNTSPCTNCATRQTQGHHCTSAKLKARGMPDCVSLPI